MFEEWMGTVTTSVMMILVIFMMIFYVRGNANDDEVKRLQKMLREKNDSIFYSVVFLGKNLKRQEKEITKTIYDIEWKIRRSNGRYNDRLQHFSNGLDPGKWYVLELREAENWETWYDFCYNKSPPTPLQLILVKSKTGSALIGFKKLNKSSKNI